MNRNIYRDAGAGGDGGGGAAGAGAGGAGLLDGGGKAAGTSFADMVPAEYRSEPSIANIKSLSDLFKGYVSAQKLVGVDKMPAPQKTWTETQWAEFHDRLGRPKTPDEYKESGQVKLKDGLTVDEARLKGIKAVFHKEGLTGKQAAAILDAYYNAINESEGAVLDALHKQRAEGERTLKERWGEKFDGNLELAQHAAAHFGEEFIGALRSANLMNNPAVAEGLYKIGVQLSEDTDRKGSFVLPGGKAAAEAEIIKMKDDPDFMTALNTRAHPGHKDAVDRWFRWHQEASKK